MSRIVGWRIRTKAVDWPSSTPVHIAQAWLPTTICGYIISAKRSCDWNNKVHYSTIYAIWTRYCVSSVAAFDSVDRLALWKALRGRRIPDVLLDLIIALHDNTSVRVRFGKQLSDPLLTTSGVRQGYVLAPALFCVAIDWILKHMKSRPGITVGRDLFTDLVYADDTAFFVESPASAATCLSSFAETASVFGLPVSWPKTKTQNLGPGPPNLTQYLSMETS